MSEALTKITEELKIEEARTEEIQKKIKNITDFKKEIDKNSSKDISSFSEVILIGGFQIDASDLHIEPREAEAEVRARIDGVLQEITALNRKTYESFLSRIKLLSGVKLNISDRPQDGRFSVLTKDKNVEVRVSTLPAEHGESIVLRILNPKSLINLEFLGLREDLLKICQREIKRPNGMIIITGPTGSGKTTSLYSFLKKIHKPEIKIITIEDPIEYHLKGVSQTQVNPKKGYDFASGLKSLMRQDPDVILVGEIRDLETTEIALQAALTGHLVLTTLHTNDAAGTIARLMNLGAKIANISPAINLIIAQRLVRKVCKKCVVFEPAQDSALEEIKKDLAGLPKSIKIPEIKPGLKIAKAKGCPECNLTGYKGRIGVFEVLVIDGQMEKFLLKNYSISALREESEKRGMTTIRQDGMIKVLDGITSLEELKRVLGE